MWIGWIMTLKVICDLIVIAYYDEHINIFINWNVFWEWEKDVWWEMRWEWWNMRCWKEIVEKYIELNCDDMIVIVVDWIDELAWLFVGIKWLLLTLWWSDTLFDCWGEILWLIDWDEMVVWLFDCDCWFDCWNGMIVGLIVYVGLIMSLIV